MKFIDLSLTLENNRSYAPWWAVNRVKYQSHRFGRFAMWLLFGVSGRHLRTGLGWANEVIKLSTHGTTHVDAPWHYGPECAGQPAKTIDELPLERFYGRGVVLDFQEKPPDHAATVSDLEAALEKMGHQLSPGEIVLVRTGNDRFVGTREYFTRGPGVSAEATRWLVDQEIRLTGIDSWGWDAPLARQAREAKRTGGRDVFFAAHYVGVDKEYCHMERLANLGQLPPAGFTICAFPLKVKRGSAGPARVVALIEE
jgi:kynurenine formamidase